MTLCLWVKHPFLCHFVKPLAFVLFLLRYMDFQNHLPMRTDASAGGVFTILLCFYYISAHCLGYCICTYASERYFHVRSDKQVKIAPVQTAAKPVKKLLWRAVSRISLINQQSNPTAITCQSRKHSRLPDCLSEVSQLRSHLPEHRPPNNAGLFLLHKVSGLF